MPSTWTIEHVLELRGGGWRAALLPEQGAAFAALEHEGRPILQPLEGRDPNTTPAGAFWMLPWTNRLDGGAFRWAGETYRFPITHPAEGNALHGLARARAWVVEDAASGVLRSLGQEVYTTPEDAGVVGAAGQSTWRYQVYQAGEGRLLMHYRRPWEVEVAPAKTIDCKISVR